MGVGHVSPRSLREAGQGHDVPRRQHRGAGAHSGALSGDRAALARLGERIAAAFLVRKGARVLGWNVAVGRGELDLVVEIDRTLVAVEVKTIGPAADATDVIDRISATKLRQVRSLAGRLAASERRPVRVDFVGVLLDEEGATINWRTAIA